MNQNTDLEHDLIWKTALHYSYKIVTNKCAKVHTIHKHPKKTYLKLLFEHTHKHIGNIYIFVCVCLCIFFAWKRTLLMARSTFIVILMYLYHPVYIYIYVCVVRFVCVIQSVCHCELLWRKWAIFSRFSYNF